MKKIILFAVFVFALVLAGCGNNTSTKNTSKESKTVTYKSEDGNVKVPAAPKRVVVLSSFTGDLLQLGINVVGADSFSMANPNFKKGLKKAKQVSDENIEEIIALKPDLIVGLSNIKNKEKFKKIAPVITFTYNKYNYLDQFMEIGKLTNKVKEARALASDFKQRAKATGTKIKEKIGADKTIIVAEKYDKQLYIYGDNWGRGTEILYQAMKFKMPTLVKKTTLKSGYYAISPEELSKYVGDYLLLSSNNSADNSYRNTAAFKNIPAVKNKHVLHVDMEKFYFNDMLTLRYQLKVFENYFLGNK